MRQFAEEWGFAAAIAYVLFLRAERSYSSIRILARTRMADDAFALVRVMVEKIINGQYILLLGTETALDYIQYQAFREWRDLEELRSVEQNLVPEYSPEALNNLRAAYEAAKTKTAPDGSSKERFGRGHDWIEIGLGKRAEQIDEILRRRLGAKSFKATQVLYHTTYKKSATYLHGTWASVARSLELEKDD